MAADAADAGACVLPVDYDPGAVAEPATDQPAVLKAEQGDFDRATQTYTATGNVTLERDRRRLRADELTYQTTTDRADARGNLQYEQPGLSVSAKEGHLFLDQSTGELREVEFRLLPGAPHGEADKVELKSRSEAEFEDVRYTSCPVGQEDWWLSAQELTVDREEGFGVARHASLRFFGVPLLYTPYISFPIDDRRKTGLLPPRFRYTDEDGLDVAQPYYLNLAPNYDATLTPRLITQRGMMLESEGRLLERRFATELNFNYLPDDKEFHDDRWLLHWGLASRLSGPWRFVSDVNRVSDREYLDDFGEDLVAVSVDHLPSTAQLSYLRPRWSAHALVQSWQSLDTTLLPQERPYRLLPRLRFDLRDPPDGSPLAYRLAASATRFAHPHEELVDTGSRVDLAAVASWRHERPGYFVIPSVGAMASAYSLDRPDPSLADSPSRALPLFSLDTGLFFERELDWGGRPLRQTLEPRLYYLYVPYRDQSELPLFDTEEAQLSLDQLFELNRFTGPDRVGDANYFALMVSSRLVNRETGREHLRAAIGQAYYLQNRRVVVDDAVTAATQRMNARGSSPLLGELRASAGDWTGYADYYWDPYDTRALRRTLRLSYRPAPRSVVSLGYRMRRAELGEPLEQSELAVVWPLNAQWLGVAGWHYSLEAEETVERYAGLAYNSCCWSARAVVREYVREPGDEPVRAIMFQLELTGLGRFGQSLDQFLSDTVSGFGF